MKKLLVPLLLCALLLTACGGQEKEGGSTTTSFGPKTSSAEKDAQKEAVRTAAEQALAGAFDGELTVKVRTDRVEVSVLLSDPAYSADAEVPADWPEVKEETAETTLSLSEALSELGEYRALIYLMDQQETILLSAFNGKASFDKFEKRAKAGQTGGITLDAFEQIMEGMLYEDVCAIIGEEGELLSAVEDGEIYTEIYSWSGSDGASATVVFENGLMVSKTQVGLEPSFDDFIPSGSSSGSSGGMMFFPGGGVVTEVIGGGEVSVAVIG